jgi:hypothetical protein
VLTTRRCRARPRNHCTLKRGVNMNEYIAPLRDMHSCCAKLRRSRKRTARSASATTCAACRSSTSSAATPARPRCWRSATTKARWAGWSANGLRSLRERFPSPRQRDSPLVRVISEAQTSWTRPRNNAPLALDLGIAGRALCHEAAADPSRGVQHCKPHYDDSVLSRGTGAS